MSSYVAGMRRRQAVAARRRAERQCELRRRAEAIACSLVRHFGATRVTLFGSVARGEATENSDIDLFVEGIDGPSWLAAQLAAEDLSKDANVDLVLAANARPEIAERAIIEGLVLHD